jgi:hypothetical protein
MSSGSGAGHCLGALTEKLASQMLKNLVETEIWYYTQNAARSNDKQTSIATVRDQYQTYVTVQMPFGYLCSLLLSKDEK